MKNVYEKGVTLIVLVITIITLIIISGITINMLFSDDSILKNAQSVANDREKQELKEKILSEIAQLQMTNLEVTFEDIAEALIDINVTTEDMVVYESNKVITNLGYIAQLTEDSSNNWTVELTDADSNEYILAKNDIYPSATGYAPYKVITVTAIQTNGGIKKITLPNGTVKTYGANTTLAKEEYEVGENGTYTFIIESNNGETKNYSVPVTHIDIGTIAIGVNKIGWATSVDVDVVWPSKSETGYTKQISTDNGSSYHEYTGKVTLTANTTVKARLLKNSEVIKEADPFEINKIDREAPTGTVSLSGYTVLGDVLGVTATITSNDNNKSGVNYSKSKYIINKSATALGTSESVYTGGSLTGATTTISKTKPEGTYYVHALLIDNVGNSREVVSATSLAVTGKKDFEYTGSVQSITLPAGYYKLEVWGAQGGNSYYGGYTGGKGGYSKGIVSLSSNTNINVYVGGVGNKGALNSQTLNGGFNGGGEVGGSYYNSSSSYEGGSGGGASDMRIASTSLYARVIVAGGGGGAGYYNGGAGGGSNGIAGVTYSSRQGSGATQTAGGAAGTSNNSNATAGTFGNGGRGAYSSSQASGAGGGGGWYGRRRRWLWRLKLHRSRRPEALVMYILLQLHQITLLDVY